MTAHLRSDEMRMVVVFERQPYWEPELRRQFHNEQVAVRACRTLGDLEQITSAAPECVVVAELADRPAELLRWLARRLTSGRFLPVVVVTNPRTAGLVWHASEAGAIAIVGDDCGGHHLACLCRKQWPSLARSRTE